MIFVPLKSGKAVLCYKRSDYTTKNVDSHLYLSASGVLRNLVGERVECCPRRYAIHTPIQVCREYHILSMHTPGCSYDIPAAITSAHVCDQQFEISQVSECHRQSIDDAFHYVIIAHPFITNAQRGQYATNIKKFIYPNKNTSSLFKQKKTGYASRHIPSQTIMKRITLFYPRNPSNAPAATAEPITPATFGPIACISR